jgi:hypothetical protein
MGLRRDALEAQIMTEFTIAGFAAHIEKLAAGMPALEMSILSRIGVRVTTAAKDKIGDYQGEAGPFAAWAPLKDATRADRLRAGYSEDDPLLRSGELRDSIEYVVVPPEVVIGSPLDIALWQEMGTATIPPRSFLGGAAFELTPALLAESGTKLEAYLGAR